MLLRVPGIGVKSANKICAARKTAKLDFDDLKKLGVVLKRAQYFILCCGRQQYGLVITPTAVMRQLMSASTVKKLDGFRDMEQLSLFDDKPQQPTIEDYRKCLTGQM